MATITLDLIEGSSLTIDGKQWSRTRAGYIAGLTNTVAAELIPAATAAVLTAVGGIGASDPYQVSGAPPLYLKQVNVTAGIEANDANVSLVYKVDDGTFTNSKVIEVGATASEVQANLCYNNGTTATPLFLNYTDANGTAYPTKLATFPALKNRSVYTVKRNESYGTNSAAAAIGANSQLYSGKLNSATWHGSPQYSWRCLGIMGTSNDGGFTYNVNYSFEYSDEPQGWLSLVKYPFDRQSAYPTDADWTAFQAQIAAIGTDTIGGTNLVGNGYAYAIGNLTADFNNLTGI